MLSVCFSFEWLLTSY